MAPNRFSASFELAWDGFVTRLAEITHPNTLPPSAAEKELANYFYTVGKIDIVKAMSMLDEERRGRTSMSPVEDTFHASR